LGYLVTGDTKKAGGAWQDYREESVLGSGVASAISAISGDTQEATRLAKGMGRATGQAMLGGGLLSDVPVFKELSKCGRSLGDVIGGGDTKSACQRWTEEYIQEISDPHAVPKALLSIGTAAVGVGVTMASAGLATPAFMGAAAATGAGCATADTAAKQTLDIKAGKRKRFDAGDLVGSALTGGAMGASTAGLVRAFGAAPEQNLAGTRSMRTAPESTIYQDSMSAGQKSLYEAAPQSQAATKFVTKPAGSLGGAAPKGGASLATARSAATAETARSAGTHATAVSARTALSASSVDSHALGGETYYQGCPSEWADLVKARQLRGLGPEFPEHQHANQQLGNGLYASRDRAVAESYAQHHGLNGRLLKFRVDKGVAMEIRDVTHVGKELTRGLQNDPGIDVAFQNKVPGTMDQACFRTDRACGALKLLSVEIVKPRPVIR